MMKSLSVGNLGRKLVRGTVTVLSSVVLVVLLPGVGALVPLVMVVIRVFDVVTVTNVHVGFRRTEVVRTTVVEVMVVGATVLFWAGSVGKTSAISEATLE